MKSAFPGLSFSEEPEDIVEPETIVYLWETSLDIFNIYKIAKDYMSETYILDSTILVELIKEKNHSMSEILKSIPYIHSGYIKVLIDHFNRTKKSSSS